MDEPAADQELQPHPLAEIFPPMTERQLQALAEDIKQNGLKETIVLLEGKILDGRNRYVACRRAGVEPKDIEFNEDTDGDPAAFVASKNLQRRHLTTSQRAFAAAGLGMMGQGRPKSGQKTAFSRNELATLFCVSEKTIARAYIVQKKAVPELLKAVTAGRVSLGAAEILVDLSPEKQALLAETPTAARKEVARIRRRRKQNTRRVKRSSPHDSANTEVLFASPDPASPDHSAMPRLPGGEAGGLGAEGERVAQALAKAAHEIDPDDIAVREGSRSQNARPSRYAIIRLPNSHPDRQGLEEQLQKLAENYNTDIIFKALPDPKDAVDRASARLENANA